MTARTCSRFATGVVIGKFLPPHRGHKFLIDTARSQCDRVTAIVCEKTSDLIPGKLRAAWMREIHPDVEVLLIDDHYDETDSRIWAENTIRWMGGRAPDAAFTSEDYGDRYATLMGSVHVLVDKARHCVPCSGTVIRQDPFANWEFLEPPVRAWFVKRICVLGAESTGTTSLAQELAEFFDTAWVPEFGREYSELKQSAGQSDWRTAEFVHIAAEQSRREDVAARDANRLLICDTNAFATALWHRRYMGIESEEVWQQAERVKCDFYFLTGDEIPFVQDGLRDGEHIRHEMHKWFEDALRNQKVPWMLLRGSHEERMRTAVEAIEKLFNSSGWKFPQPKLPVTGN